MKYVVRSCRDGLNNYVPICIAEPCDVEVRDTEDSEYRYVGGVREAFGVVGIIQEIGDYVTIVPQTHKQAILNRYITVEALGQYFGDEEDFCDWALRGFGSWANDARVIAPNGYLCVDFGGYIIHIENGVVDCLPETNQGIGSVYELVSLFFEYFGGLIFSCKGVIMMHDSGSELTKLTFDNDSPEGRAYLSKLALELYKDAVCK